MLKRSNHNTHYKILIGMADNRNMTADRCWFTVIEAMSAIPPQTSVPNMCTYFHPWPKHRWEFLGHIISGTCFDIFWVYNGLYIYI